MDLSDDSHGTRVAGIAAALTNNDGLGIAGIAGGWWPDTIGCSLVAFKCGDTSYVDRAALCGAIRDAGPVWGVDVLNASEYHWDYSVFIHNAVHDAHNAGVVFVAAKGDSARSDDLFPADYNRDWITCVGGAGRFGSWRRAHIDYDHGFTANYGIRLDLLAPSVQEMAPIRGGDYSRANGSSFGTAMVSGVAGLVLSECDTLLVGEVEGILKASCADIRFDRDGGEGLDGYDQWSGWGLVDADSALRFLRDPYSIVRWVGQGGYIAHAYSTGLWHFVFEDGEPTPYLAKLYEVRHNASWGSLFGMFHSAWGLGVGSETTGWTAYDPNHMTAFCEVVPGTLTSTGCQLRSFVFQIWGLSGNPYYGWNPCEPQDVVFSCMLLGGEPQAAVEATSPDLRPTVLNAVRIQPNPAVRGAVASMTLGEPEFTKVEIYDVLGRPVRAVFEGALGVGGHDFEWDGCDDSGHHVSPGVYFWHFQTRQRTVVRKVVLAR